uniref:Uncharacterized protein n=1 Tax=Opuntia streptacantha TaxID=393608 RepID=A0A7C8ZER3_OPUST
MGRGKAKIKKLMVTTEAEDPVTSDEERVPTQKRRGRLQKQLKIEIEGDGEEDTETENVINNDDTGTADLAAMGKKRDWKLQSKAVKLRLSSGEDSSGDGSVRTSIGAASKPKRRRKTKPRRAAEVGLRL